MFIVIVLLLHITSAFAAPAEAAPIVDLGYAKYEGTVDTATSHINFFGMRYAASPTGNFRWRSPHFPETITAVQQANVQPPSCMSAGSGTAPTSPFRQRRGIQATTVVSEDCLFLNVFTPELTSRLPVVVWIHGGGYEAGSAPSFNGNDLIKEANGGVVVVVIQYRLGIFGFLAGSQVKANGALNAGLLDQEFALRWVQEHITKFGGDPSKVTIWGESAGAGSVIQHVIAHGGKTNPPLFRGAITSSSFLPSQYAYDDPITETLYQEAVSQTNCSSAADSLACLRSVDVGLLQTANTKICASGFFGTFVFVPVVDGDFITQRPTVALKQRKVNGMSLMSVTNVLEGFNFVNQSTATTVQTPEYISQLFPKFDSRAVATAASLYKDLGSPISQVTAIMGESIFICPTYFLMRAFSNNAFKGTFAVPPSHHGDDVQYYFPSQTSTGFPAFNNTAFDKAFSESFMDFAMSLNPNIKSDSSSITPLWNFWGGEIEMIFNRTTSGQPVVQPVGTSSILLQRCDFWESVGALSGQ